MAVVKFPIHNTTVLPLACECWCELGPDLSCVSIAKLVVHSAVLVEDSMVRLDEVKEGVARVEVRTTVDEARILFPEPATPIGVVIHSHHVLLRHDRPENLQLDGQLDAATAGLQDGTAAINTRPPGTRDPDIHPESLGRLPADAIVRLREVRAVRNLDGNERVGTVTLIAFEVVKPLPVDFGLDSALSRCQAEFESVGFVATWLGNELKRNITATGTLE